MDGMKRRIEKTALNAQKARQMAKEVGLIPVPGTGWKAALRKMRKGTGELLTGKELAKIKEELGVLPNNTRQKILSKLKGLAPGTEVGASLDRKGRIIRDLDAKYIDDELKRHLKKQEKFLKDGKIPKDMTMVGEDGIRIGPMRKGSVSSYLGSPRGVHTHPAGERILDKKEAKVFNNNMLKWKKRKKQVEEQLGLYDELLKYISEGKSDKDYIKTFYDKLDIQEYYDKFTRSVDNVRSAQKYENLTNTKLPASRLSRGFEISSGGDYEFGVDAAKAIRKKDGRHLNGSAEDLLYKNKKPGRHPYIENILGQADNTESVNKVFPDGKLKSLYFKHASKEARDLIEKLAKKDEEIKKVNKLISNGDKERKDQYQESLKNILKFIKDSEKEEDSSDGGE